MGELTYNRIYGGNTGTTHASQLSSMESPKLSVPESPDTSAHENHSAFRFVTDAQMGFLMLISSAFEVGDKSVDCSRSLLQV